MAPGEVAPGEVAPGAVAPGEVTVWVSILLICIVIVLLCADPEGAGVRTPPPPPPEKITHKNIEFLSKTGPDSLKNTKLPSQHSMSSHHLPASETSFKWPFAGVSMMAR